MAYSRVGTPKFYIDAVLLARQWGMIESESSSYGKYHLNPSKFTEMDFAEANSTKYIYVDFKKRYFCNAISHCFILGHNFHSDEILVRAFAETEHINEEWGTHPYTAPAIPYPNGWLKLPNFTTDTSKELVRFIVKLTSPLSQTIKFADISAGWSFSLLHSPDLELTQTISNESIKTQTTVGGHTLSNAGYNYQPKWGRRPAWSTGTIPATSSFLDSFDVFPSGRRSWSLKFSFVSDEKLFPSAPYSGYGIFEKLGTTEDESAVLYDIKDNFVSKVLHGTNNYQLPFLFQPNQDVEEYAICRIDSNTATFKQVANNVYDISINIVETW